MVAAGKATHCKDDSKLSEYGDYKIMYDITEGSAGNRCEARGSPLPSESGTSDLARDQAAIVAGSTVAIFWPECRTGGSKGSPSWFHDQ